MKVLPALLVASLVANAALVTLTLRKSSTETDNATALASATESSAPLPRATTPVGKIDLPPELVAALNGNNPEALRDMLRAAGLSDDLVRTIVQMRIWKNYEPRFKALHPQNEPDPNKPWWKNERNAQNPRNQMTKEQREESRRLQRESREEIERVLGADPNQHRWQDQRLVFLSAEKRQALQDIQRDYQELISEVRQEAQDFRLPSDAEKLRFLQEEQQRDLDALMTPEEREAYELRMSNTAQQLRWKTTQYDMNEDEYRAIFPLQKAFDEKYNQPNELGGPQPERGQDYWKARTEAEKEIQERIQTLIGEERFTESLRLQDNDWRQLEAATRRLELPADTPARLYSLRETTAADVQQIASNPNLAADQKKAALAALAASTRDQVRASLGAEGADAYFQNNGMRWLKELEKGNTITFRKDGNGWDTKALPKEPKTPAKN